MKIYSHFDVNEFIICLGHLGYYIKEYFSNYYLHNADVTFDMESNRTTFHTNRTEPWKVTLVETGPETMTGGRLRRIIPFLDENEDFCMTYGDGVADVNIRELIAFHQAAGRKATVTCVTPPARFGRISVAEGTATLFEEKPMTEGGLINGGFFVLRPSALELCSDDDSVWELDPMRQLAADGELSAFIHHGFWQPMDTLRDRNILETLWAEGRAPWKLW
jgi:glucose-1-phosphate cytidylyltransferase